MLGLMWHFLMWLARRGHPRHPFGPLAAPGGFTEHDVLLHFHDWVMMGNQAGWCGPPVCLTHDGPPMSIFELDDWLKGVTMGDPDDDERCCVHVIRLYDDQEHRAEVEATHGPSRTDGA